MTLLTTPFDHAFDPGAIRFGRGRVADLGDLLGRLGRTRALVVCGPSTAETPAVIEPVIEGLGDNHAGTFDEAGSAKRLETAVDGAEAVAGTEADVLIAVGSGSSIDTARAISVVDASGRPAEALREDLLNVGTLSVDNLEGTPLPTVPVPTTFAGAGLSSGFGVTLKREGSVTEAIVAGDALRPPASIFDPTLYAATPIDVLTASAMNGFDKGIEMAYSRFANPLTDAMAVRGLRYFRSGLPRLSDSADQALDQAVVGSILVQQGVAGHEAPRINVIHAICHALRTAFGLHQGVAHAVMAPHVLNALFQRDVGRVDLLHEALAPVTSDLAPEAAVLEAVRDVRDHLGMPTRLRSLDGTERDRLRAVAEDTMDDHLIEVGPADFSPDVDLIKSILDDAW